MNLYEPSHKSANSSTSNFIRVKLYPLFFLVTGSVSNIYLCIFEAKKIQMKKYSLEFTAAVL